MANFTKFKWYGYLDLCTSVSQLVVTSTCTLFSLHLEFTRKVEPKQLYFFSPTFNLICTLSILFATLKQVDCARHLIRAGRNVLFLFLKCSLIKKICFFNVPFLSFFSVSLYCGTGKNSGQLDVLECD